MPFEALQVTEPMAGQVMVTLNSDEKRLEAAPAFNPVEAPTANMKPTSTSTMAFNPIGLKRMNASRRGVSLNNREEPQPFVPLGARGRNLARVGDRSGLPHLIRGSLNAVPFLLSEVLPARGSLIFHS